MFRYFVQRLLVMIPTLIVISIAIFVIIQAPPGDWIESYIAQLKAQGEAVDPAKIEFLRQTYGLDLPSPAILKWAAGCCRAISDSASNNRCRSAKVVGDRPVG
jgi:peptide/nickel transport system permease protein